MIFQRFKLISIFLVIFSSYSLSQNQYSFVQKVSSQKYFEQRELNLEIFNNNKLLYNFHRTLEPNRSVPQVFILDNNHLLLIFTQDGLLEFYNQNELVKKHLLYKTYPLNEQSIISSKSINEVAVLISELQKNKIYLFDFNGDTIDSMKVEDGLISGLSISSDNKFIAYSLFNWENNDLKNKTVCVDKATNKHFLINEKFTNGIFNSDDSSFLGFTNKNAFCFDLNNSELLWKDELKNKEIFLDGNFKNNNAILVKAEVPNLENGNWIYSNAEIISKDKLGKESLLEQIKTKFQKISFVNADKNIKVKVDSQILELAK